MNKLYIQKLLRLISAEIITIEDIKDEVYKQEVLECLIQE